jgi:hypothetical protein
MKFGNLLLIIFCQVFSSSHAQKILQMDINKFGGRVQYKIGDQIEFQLNNKDWYKFTITDFDFEKQEIIFDDAHVPISRITKLYYVKRQVKNTTLGFAALFGTFGITWSAYTIYGLIVASPMVGPATVIVGITALSLSAVLFFSKFLWKRKYKINKERRLRIIDLTIYPDAANIDVECDIDDLIISTS